MSAKSDSLGTTSQDNCWLLTELELVDDLNNADRTSRALDLKLFQVVDQGKATDAASESVLLWK